MSVGPINTIINESCPLGYKYDTLLQYVVLVDPKRSVTFE